MRTLIYFRSGRPVRRFSPREDERITELRIAGRSLSSIGREIGRQKHSVHQRLISLAKRDEAKIEDRR